MLSATASIYCTLIHPDDPIEEAVLTGDILLLPRHTIRLRNEFWRGQTDTDPYRLDARLLYTNIPVFLRPGHRAVVLDGQSENYTPKRPYRRYENGLSGGGMVQTIVAESLYSCERIPAADAMEVANVHIRQWHLSNQVNFADPTQRSGTTLALAEITMAKDEPMLDIHNVSDTLAIWQLRNGELRWTANPVKAFDGLGREFRRSLEQTISDPDEIQARFTDEHVGRGRREVMNNRGSSMGFPVMNGDPNCWFDYTREPLENVAWFALASDGCFPTITDEEPSLYIGRFADHLLTGGWDMVHRWVRNHQKNSGAKPAEASGLYYHLS
jgi:hypothetical protein